MNKIKQSQAVRVFAPATVANVGIGYDILGFAIEGLGDEVVARYSEEKGLRITNIHGSEKILPKDPHKNTAGLAALELLKHLGQSSLGVDLEIYKKMPFGSGLGSSAASAAAGVLAVNELLGRPLTKEELAPFAVVGESAADGAIHGDNVLPSLLGGIVLIRDNDLYKYIKLPVPAGLKVFVLYPEIEILTKDARAILSPTVSMAQMIKQSGNLGSFVSALYRSDFELMKDCLEDCIIEPQRAKLIPHFYDLKALALSKGAMNYTISGAGPSMFGFALNSLIADEVAESLQRYLLTKDIASRITLSDINSRGAYKM